MVSKYSNIFQAQATKGRSSYISDRLLPFNRLWARCPFSSPENISGRNSTLYFARIFPIRGHHKNKYERNTMSNSIDVNFKDQRTGDSWMMQDSFFEQLLS